MMMMIMMAMLLKRNCLRKIPLFMLVVRIIVVYKHRSLFMVGMETASLMMAVMMVILVLKLSLLLQLLSMMMMMMTTMAMVI